MMKINIDGTANVVNAALNAGVRKLCYVSSIAALGRGSDNNIITEDTHWKTSSYNSHYAISKYGGEREVWRAVEEGLDAVIVNPAIILGLGSTDGGTARLFHSVWKGLHIYPKGINGFVDVRDVTRVMVMLMDSDIKNKRFILSAVSKSYHDLFAAMAKEFGVKKPGIPANRALTSIAWRIEYLRSSLFGSRPLVTRETAITSSQDYIYSGERITQTLKFDYIPFEETVKYLAGEFRKAWTK
jgi:nucleoside-diphosphate-sugar epimerase